ncbi:L-2-hydroxyglutarate oxidase [Thermosynechococcaceae cyanobacterium Okahandja]
MPVEVMTVDFLIIGAGIIGITIALELRKRYPEAKILMLEKEPTLGMHASGRNSGVLHSGIYYAPGSLKAKVCRQGALEMAEFHREHQLRLRQCGKILVVTDPENEPQLDKLADRAQQNGIAIEMLDEQQLHDLEPEARSVGGRAMYVPSTAVGDPVAVMQKLSGELKAKNVALRLSAKIAFVAAQNRHVKLQSGEIIEYGHAINTAGLQADNVAHQFGVGQRYTLLPFKGIYWKLNPESSISFNHLIYPVPDIRFPFLGIHTTTTVDGTTYLGPTAVPAFSRENYKGLQNVNIPEAKRILSLLIQQYLANRDGFRRLAWQEGRRYFKHWFVKAAQAIAPRIESNHLLPAEKVGIRAQILDTHDGKLVNDFLVGQGSNSTHILNAISPAWTSAFPFARYVCDHYLH